MQRVQRKFGTFLKRSEDEADVGVVLKEYEDADKFLATYIAHGESWREAWRNILRTQLSSAESFHTLYQPIGADENVNHLIAATPEGPLMKVHRLESVYAELNSDLANEVAAIDLKLLKPAAEAKDSLKMLKKVIKKREDRKLDYERYLSRVETLRRKETKSAKEDAALMKHESDLAIATQEYQSSDEQIKRAFPPLLDAIASLLPHLLATQIMLQHSLVANFYTSVYGYCAEQGFPVSAPPLEAVVSDWDSSFTPLRHEAENGLEMLAGGKAVHQPMELRESQGQTVTGLGLRNKLADRRKSSHGSGSIPRPSVPSIFNRGAKEEEEGPTKPPRLRVSGTPSQSYIDEDEAPPVKPPRPGQSSPSKPRISSSRLTPSNSNPGSPYDGSSVMTGASRPITSPYRNSGTIVNSGHSTPLSNNSTSRLSGGNDYFSRGGKPLTSSVASSVAAKKKPPPPPPAKRIPSAQGQFVTALYDFAGQNASDLSFQEGDRIRVIKKTESFNDWWEGEIAGVKGSFPANYVQV